MISNPWLERTFFSSWNDSFCPKHSNGQNGFQMMGVRVGYSALTPAPTGPEGLIVDHWSYFLSPFLPSFPTSMACGSSLTRAQTWAPAVIRTLTLPNFWPAEPSGNSLEWVSERVCFSLSLSLSLPSFLSFFLSFFRAIPTAYGSSQVTGQIGDAATGLYHSQSNARSQLSLRPTPQLIAMPDP